MLDVSAAYEAWCMPVRSSSSPSGGGRGPSLPSWLAPRPPSDVAPSDAEPAAAPPPSAPDPIESLEAAPDLDDGPRSEAIPPPPSTPSLRDWEGELAALEDDVVAATAAATAHRKAVLAASERDLVSLAIAIAERVIGREISLDPSLVATLAREGVAALTDQDDLTIAIAPDVAERVPADAWQRALDNVPPPVVDPKLGAARVEVRGKFGRVDASVAARLDAVVRAMGEPDE
jgi:hypothetical protein